MMSVKISENTHYENTCDIRIEDNEVVFYKVSEVQCMTAGETGNTLLRTTKNIQEVDCPACNALIHA